MLETSSQRVGKPDLSTLPLLVELPSCLKNFFNEGGFAQSSYDERRSNVRRKVRKEAILVTDHTFAFHLCERISRTLVKDVSLRGIGLLCHQQYWPTEEFWVLLDGVKRHCRVVRCLKLGPNCYEVGAVVDRVDQLA